MIFPFCKAQTIYLRQNDKKSSSIKYIMELQTNSLFKWHLNIKICKDYYSIWLAQTEILRK